MPSIPNAVTVPKLRDMKRGGDKIAMVTAYDASFAAAADAAGVDAILVGDSLGMVVQGQSSTLPVTVDQIVYHTAAAARGTHRAPAVRARVALWPPGSACDLSAARRPAHRL